MLKHEFLCMWGVKGALVGCVGPRECIGTACSMFGNVTEFLKKVVTAKGAALYTAF